MSTEKRTSLQVEVVVKRPGPEPHQAWASIIIGGATVYTELVYDNPENTAEENITSMFGSALGRLLSPESY